MIALVIVGVIFAVGYAAVLYWAPRCEQCGKRIFYTDGHSSRLGVHVECLARHPEEPHG